MSTIPTIGFNVETVQHKNIKFQVWDLGGQTSIRPYWRCYYPNTQVRARVPRPPPRGRTPPPSPRRRDDTRPSLPPAGDNLRD